MRRLNSLLLAGITLASLLALPAADAIAQGRGRPERQRPRLGLTRQLPRAYEEEPAFARGYADGRQRGLAVAKRGQRYDPVESREYRNGDRGYAASYGSRDAYKVNYRAGFRQGYDDGYREATR